MTSERAARDTHPGRNKIDRGPTGRRVGPNVRRWRERRGLTVRALSGLLADAGHPILPSGLTKLETGVRAVDVDDLVALACVLNCTPNTLLLGPTAEDRPLALTEGRTITERQAWAWARRTIPLTEYEDYATDAGVLQSMAPGLYADDPGGHSDDPRVEFAWHNENRPDEPEADPRDIVAALVKAPEAMERLVTADVSAEDAGISEPVRSTWVLAQRAHRMARLGANGGAE